MRFLVCVLFFLFAGIVGAGESLLSKPTEFALPFASKPDSDRGYVDITLPKTARIADSSTFRVDFECTEPEAVGSMTFYLRSGNGWYSYSLPIPDELSRTNKRVQMEFSLSALNGQTEDAPGPLDEADTIRFSIWRGASKDATVKLYDIRPVPFSIVALIDDEQEGRQYGTQLLRRMNRAGIPTGSLPQGSVTEKMLENYRVIVLPLNSKIPAETVTVLKNFVEKGGKIVAFYQIPTDLLKILGFEPGKYVKPPEDDTALAEVRFDRSKNDPFRMVPDLKQKSWNIHTAKPSSEYDARCVAWWYDAAGRKTEYPALLVSERGAFFSHILTGEDAENKQKFLVELFGLYDSSFRHDAVIRAWKALFSVGDPRTMSAAKRAIFEKHFLAVLKKRGFDLNATFFTKEAPTADLRRLPELYENLLKMREQRVRTYCESVQARLPEFRAWWEHAGLGAYPGDWDRTMKELSDAGFNTVISNLLWGGSAHYASDVLPRSKKFEQYGDQIEQSTKAGRKFGIDVHAWQVCYWMNGSPPEFIEKMKQTNRTQVSHDGQVGEWLCPSHPENIDLETATFVELARKYKDLAGIHYDYIRYPDGSHCYCTGCRERFAKDTGLEIRQWPQDVRGGGPFTEKFEQWRCDQISKLVERVHREVKAIRPDLKISAAVFSGYPGCRKSIAQDWGLWVEKGWLDFICPMDYTAGVNQFEALIARQKSLIKDRIPLYPGIGATATGISMTPDQVVTQIEVVRKMNVPGFVIFNLDAKTIQRIPPYTKLGATKK